MGCKVTRRGFLNAAGAFAVAARLKAASGMRFIEPANLAHQLQSGGSDMPHVICVTFPVLYRQKRIRGAVYAGPGSKPEGIAKLQEALQPLRKDTPIVIYCGCCPLDHCPNVAPAYSKAVSLGFTAVRVLNLPTNFHTDWEQKRYPTD